jgi:hypothetical protein
MTSLPLQIIALVIDGALRTGQIITGLLLQSVVVIFGKGDL